MKRGGSKSCLGTRPSGAGALPAGWFPRAEYRRSITRAAPHGQQLHSRRPANNASMITASRAAPRGGPLCVSRRVCVLSCRTRACVCAHYLGRYSRDTGRARPASSGAPRMSAKMDGNATERKRAEVKNPAEPSPALPPPSVQPCRHGRFGALPSRLAASAVPHCCTASTVEHGAARPRRQRVPSPACPPRPDPCTSSPGVLITATERAP